MKKNTWISIGTTWGLPILALLIFNSIYMSPAYFGDKILDQDDIKLGYAKSKEIRDYRAENNDEPLWTNGMFSGMPTFQISTLYNNNVFHGIHKVIAFVGGKDSSTYIIFYLMLGAFIGLRGMGVNHWLSAIGGFAYGYSGFYIIGYAAGHNAKVNTAAFIPLMILGLLLVLEKKNLKAFIWMVLFAGMAIYRNHFQITYYALLFMGIIWLTYAFKNFHEKTMADFGKQTAVLAVAGLLAIGPNIANIWSTYTYTQESMRGGASELSEKNQNQGEGGLSYDYAMSWSTGVYETVAMVIPDAAGGGGKVDYSNKGVESYDFLTGVFKSQGMSKKAAGQQANTYLGYQFLKWTGDSMGNGAYYVGASVFFLFVLAFFLVGGTTRTWVIASLVFFTLLAWGSNFDAFNAFMFKYLPMYNKFRVPSMALVVVFFLVPYYGIQGLQAFFGASVETKTAVLKKAAMVFGGFIALFGLVLPQFMDLSAQVDTSLAEQGFDVDMLLDDRKHLITASAWKSLGWGIAIAAALYLYATERIKQPVTIGLLAVLVVADLFVFDRVQLGEDNFKREKDHMRQYAANAANVMISKDTDPHFRVWNNTTGLTNDSYTSYHHKSVGGYHGAKLQRYQDLIDHQLGKNNMACFNMLNTKWIIVGGNNGPEARFNSDACGNAWSIQNVLWAANADEEMAALSNFDPKTTVVIDERFKDYLGGATTFETGTHAALKNYDPKEMTYEVRSNNESFIVFSEIYYQGAGNDWQAYVNGEPVEHIRVNYTLRGLKMPAGTSEVVFKFEPKSYTTGNTINAGFSTIFLLLLGWWGWSSFKAGGSASTEE